MTEIRGHWASKYQHSLHPRCEACGSDDVVRDAWACWDAENRCWALGAVFDHTLCQDCGTSTNLEWRTMETGRNVEDQAR